MMHRTFLSSKTASTRERRLIRQSPEKPKAQEVMMSKEKEDVLIVSLRTLDEKGPERELILDVVADAMQDGNMDEREIKKVSMLLDGVLARLSPGERMPEELTDGSNYLIFLQRAGILTPESLIAIGKPNIVTAPGAQTQTTAASGMLNAPNRPGHSSVGTEQQTRQSLPEVGKVRVRYDANTKVAIKEKHIGNDQWEMLDSWPPSTPTSRRREIVNGHFNDVSQKVDSYTQERHRRGITTDAYSTYLAREQYRKSILTARLVGRNDPAPFGEDVPASSVMRLTSSQAAEYAKWGAFVPGARYEIAGRERTAAAWTEGESPRPAAASVSAALEGGIEDIGEPYDYRHPSSGRVMVSEDARKYHDRLIQDWPHLDRAEQRYRLATLRSYRAEAKKTEQEARVFEKWEKPLHEMIFDVPPRRGMGDEDFKIRIQVPKYTIYGRDLNRLTSAPTIQQEDEMREIVFFPREMRYRTSQEAFWAAKAGLRWEPEHFAGKMQAIKLHFGQWGDFFVNHQPLHIEEDVGYVPPGYVVIQKGKQRMVVSKEEAEAFAADGGAVTTPGLYLDQPLVDPETVTAKELDEKYQAFKVASIDFQKIFKSKLARPGRIMLKPTVQGGDTTHWQTLDVWDLPQGTVKRGPFGVLLKAGPAKFENGRQTWPEIEVYLLPNSRWDAYTFEAILIEGRGQAQFRAPLQTLLPALPEQPQQPRMPTRPKVPTQPAVPTIPRQPGMPVRPQQPQAPSRPSIPQNPGIPTQPVTPGQPGAPGMPAGPTMPDSPVAPGSSARPSPTDAPAATDIPAGGPVTNETPDNGNESPVQKPDLPSGTPPPPSVPPSGVQEQLPSTPTAPGIPSQPNTPTTPGAPVIPQSPMRPQKPMPPQRPAAPTVPSSPAAAPSPAAPDKPGTPGVPNAPSQSTIPTGPAAPVIPAAPSQPSGPGKPNTPAAPNTPNRPEVPVVPTGPSPATAPAAPGSPAAAPSPAAPDKPGTPGVPNAPSQSTIPTGPAAPVTPDAPSQPSGPDTPNVPGVPSTPNRPAVPAVPSAPVLPATPQAPDSPSQPAAPQNADTPARPERTTPPAQPGAGSAPRRAPAPSAATPSSRPSAAASASPAEQGAAPKAAESMDVGIMAEHLAVMGKMLTADKISDASLAAMRTRFESLTPAHRIELLETVRHLYERGAWPAVKNPDRTWTITEPDTKGVITIQTPKTDVLFDVNKTDASCVKVQSKR